MAADVRLRTWTRGSEQDARAGLLGFVVIDLGDVIVDGITVRRTAAGRLAISFPERRDRQGHRHPIVRPISDEARREIESAVLRALGLAPAEAPP